MKKSSLLALGALLLGVSLQFGCTAKEGANPQATQATPAAAAAANTTEESPMSADYRALIPYDASAPKITTFTLVRMETTEGNLDIEVYPQAAPNAAKRFIELVEAGYYDQTPIFRVVKQPSPFVAQFGINWRPGMVEWKDRNFNDDPTLFHLERGTLAFAKAGPHTNSTQVFINYVNTDMLRSQGFTTFAKVVKGMDVADHFKSVGSPDMGLDQGMLWRNGEAYLKSLPAKDQPTMIVKAYVVK